MRIEPIMSGGGQERYRPCYVVSMWDVGVVSLLGG